MSIASSLVSDDSLRLNGIEALIDSDVVLEEFHQSEKNPRQEAQIIANLLRDQQSHKTKMAEKKEKIHRLREVLKMQREELSEVEAGKVDQRSYKLKLDNALQKIEEL